MDSMRKIENKKLEKIKMVVDINKIFMMSHETICISVASFETRSPRIPPQGSASAWRKLNVHTARAKRKALGDSKSKVMLPKHFLRLKTLLQMYSTVMTL